MFKALHAGSITLCLINEDNVEAVCSMFTGYLDSEYMLNEITENCGPKYEGNDRVNYGFYSLYKGELAGLSLLSIDSLKDRKGSTGADTLLHMRGQGVAPGSKPHLFYLGFEMLGLNRIETGCLVSNISSKRSIEKTRGFQFEGVARGAELNAQGEFEDVYMYAILRSDWLRLYDKAAVSVLDQAP